MQFSTYDKGVVESGVKYVKGNFLPTRTFRDLTDLNEQARRWVLEEAGVRIHGTTRQQPLERFLVEKPLMRPLPDVPPDLGTWHRLKLHRDCHVKFEYVLYSAPFALIGQTLWVRATDVSVSIFQDYRLVATHVRSHRPGDRRTVPDHLPPDAREFFAHDRQWCAKQARAIGPACTELIEQLLGDRIVERLRGAQGVLGLARTYGALRLEAACVRALAHASPAYRTVKSILVGGFDRQPVNPHDSDRQSVYGRNARFARDAKTLFDFDDETRH